MIVSFRTEELTQLCSIAHEATLKFGRLDAQELITYIADLEACKDAAEAIVFFEGSVEPFDEHLKVMTSFSILTLSPCETFSTTDSGKTDWRTVSSLRLDDIVEVQ